MITFIDDHREAHGVEPICRMLPIAPSTYHDHVARRSDPAKLSALAKRDQELKPEIERVFAENFEVYGARKVWRQMVREGFDVARCTVERLMADLGLHGVIRGKPIRTTVQDKAAPCPRDHVNRVFHAPAPNRLWLSDFTYVSTWSGFVYVAFVIDAYARRIVGWRVSRTAHASFVLDALEQALHERRPAHRGGLVHHSDRGSQYVSIRYSERLAEAGIEPSVGSVGDSYDNALAETINGLYKAEVIHRRGPWRSFEAVEFATLTWVTGSTTAGCWSLSATFRRPKPRSTTTPCWKNQPWPHNLSQTASGKPGAVQSGFMPAISILTFGMIASLLLHITVTFVLGFAQRKMVASFATGKPIYGFLLFKAQFSLTIMWFASSMGPLRGLILTLALITTFRIAFVKKGGRTEETCGTRSLGVPT